MEKSTLLHMRVDNVHSNGRGYLAVPPPCAYVLSRVPQLIFSDDGRPQTLKSRTHSVAEKR